MNHWLQLVTYKRGLIHLVFQKSGFLREVVVERFDCIMLCHELDSDQVRTETKLQRFVWSHWSIKGPISDPQIAIRY